MINPQLVDEQIRGGVVQGIGGALFEHCLYDERGQLLNGNMADYLVPMAAEMPDIEVGHVVTPTADSELGAKGEVAMVGYVFSDSWAKEHLEDVQGFLRAAAKADELLLPLVVGVALAVLLCVGAAVADGREDPDPLFALADAASELEPFAEPRDVGRVRALKRDQ